MCATRVHALHIMASNTPKHGIHGSATLITQGSRVSNIISQSVHTMPEFGTDPIHTQCMV